MSATAGILGEQQSYTGGSQWQTDVTVPGLALRAGVQLDDHYAVFYQGGASIFMPSLSNAVMFEVTPVRWFTVGAGGSVNYFLAGTGGCAYDSSGTCQHIPTQEAWSLGVPVRLALNAPFHVSKTSGRRLGMSFNVDVTPAYSFGGPGLPSGFQIGSVAGVGFEAY